MEEIYSGMPWMKDLVAKADPISDALRWLGYGLLEVLARIVDVLYDAIQGLLGINILEIQPIQTFVNSVSPLAWSILTLALIVAAVLLILYPRKDKGDMARGLLMAVCFMISVPFLFQTLNQFKDAGVEDVSESISATGNPGQTILLAGTYDVAGSQYDITAISGNTDPYYLDINARMPKDNAMFNKKISTVSGGVIYGESLGNGFFGWGEERLYAYQFSLIEPLFTLLIMLVCLLFTGFKLGRLLFDLVTHQVIAPLVFASDVTGAGRSKKFMQSLISNYILMVLILILLKIYLDFTIWATTGVTDVWVRILLIAGASWGVIDGPDIILKLLGVDAGTRSASAVMMGANAAVNMGRSAGGVVAGAAGAAGSLVKNAPGNLAGAVGTVAGGASGLQSMKGLAEMGAGLATNPQARSDAGVSGMSDMRNGLRSSGSSNESGSSGSGSQSQPSGYSNVPPAKSGGGQTMGERFSGNQDKVSSGIGRTAATVGYAAGKTAGAVSSVVGKVSDKINGQKPGINPPPSASTPPPSPQPASKQPIPPLNNFKPPEPSDDDTI